jgi:hypothetical protein
MDLKGVSMVLQKCGLLVLGAIGVATTNVPKFNYTSSKFSNTWAFYGFIFYFIALPIDINIIMVNIALSGIDIFI